MRHDAHAAMHTCCCCRYPSLHHPQPSTAQTATLAKANLQSCHAPTTQLSPSGAQASFASRCTRCRKRFCSNTAAAAAQAWPHLRPKPRLTYYPSPGSPAVLSCHNPAVVSDGGAGKPCVMMHTLPSGFCTNAAAGTAAAARADVPSPDACKAVPGTPRNAGVSLPSATGPGPHRPHRNP